MSALSVILLSPGHDPALLGYVAPRPIQASKILAAPECPDCSAPVYRLSTPANKGLENYVVCKGCSKLFRFPFTSKEAQETPPQEVKITPQSVEEVKRDLEKYRKWFSAAGRRPPL